MKDTLIRKINEAIQQRENLIAEANAVAGAIKAYQSLLREIQDQEIELERQFIENKLKTHEAQTQLDAENN